jgi:hypothetical protein
MTSNPSVLAFMLAHAGFGVYTGAGLHHLIKAGRTGRFKLFDWAVLIGYYGLAFWFSDYVGGHVRAKTFDSNAEWLSVALMIASFVPGWFCSVMLHRRCP